MQCVRRASGEKIVGTVAQVHPKSAASEFAQKTEGLPLRAAGAPAPPVPAMAQIRAMLARGYVDVLCINVRAKPFVPARSVNASSSFRGVSSQGNRWRARICIDKTEYTIGDFDVQAEAAKVYDIEAIRKGKLRALNFVYKGEYL